MEELLVSVIVPAYNEEENIASCLTSVFNQTLPKNRYEVIVVDNNSTDRTAAISAGFGARVVKEPNQGIAFTRMTGAKEARSEIIAFVDSDTIVSSDWLKTIMEIYQSDSSVVGIGCNLKLEPRNLLVAIFEPLTATLIKIFKILPGYGFSIKKSAYLKCGGYNPKINFSEDFYITKKIKQTGKVVIALPKDLVVTSSRRYKNLKTFLTYSSKIIISFFTVFLFNVSFFKLKPVKKKS